LGLAIGLHVLAAVVWVGGMFFAFMCLRPASQWLDAPLRLRLWAYVLSRFFRWVWPAVAILLVTGFWMVFGLYGGMANVGPHVHAMLGVGVLMVLLAAHVYFAPYKRLKRCIAVSNWPEAAKQLGQIRIFIAFNLALGPGDDVHRQRGALPRPLTTRPAPPRRDRPPPPAWP
jgi:uncharacterized membrane protein